MHRVKILLESTVPGGFEITLRMSGTGARNCGARIGARATGNCAGFSDSIADARQMPGKLGPKILVVSLGPRLAGLRVASVAPEPMPLGIPVNMASPMAPAVSALVPGQRQGEPAGVLASATPVGFSRSVSDVFFPISQDSDLKLDLICDQDGNGDEKN